MNCHPLRSQTYTIQELLNTTTGFARVGELSKHRVEFVQNLRTDQCAPERAPGLNIRDCARSLNNCVPRRPEQNAIDVTAKTIFEPERLYLVSLRNNWEDLSPCPHTPTTHSAAISQFLCSFTQVICPGTTSRTPVPSRTLFRVQKDFTVVNSGTWYVQGNSVEFQPIDLVSTARWVRDSARFRLLANRADKR